MQHGGIERCGAPSTRVPHRFFVGERRSVAWVVESAAGWPCAGGRVRSYAGFRIRTVPSVGRALRAKGSSVTSVLTYGALVRRGISRAAFLVRARVLGPSRLRPDTASQCSHHSNDRSICRSAPFSESANFA